MTFSKKVQPKRGYLANILVIPPIIYPFQYNPTELRETKSVEWQMRPPKKKSEPKSGFGAVVSMVMTAPEDLGRKLSRADLMTFKSEGPRTLNFKFTIDGREKQPGEPDRRREDGTILPDLAILRSFVYPSAADLLDVMSAALGTGEENWKNIWFKKPPTAHLFMGGINMEGFVKDLNITETMFNSDLDPVRAVVEITMIERIDSLTFIIDSVKRLGKTVYHTAYEDIGDVII